jgi:hypothetical protein
MRRRAEFLVVVSVFCVASAALAILAGSFGLSWDALNHHVYLGFFSESPRWERDVAAAASQSYQYPHIYWPFYRLTLMGMSGNTAAAVWAVFQTLCLVPPIWVASVHLLGVNNDEWEGVALRFIGCLLGFTSIPVLAAIGGSANDLLAAVPLLWAIALALSQTNTLWRVVVCGALIGASVALKYSNVLCVPLFLLALTDFSVRRETFGRLATAGTAAGVGFFVVYAPWGWQLWRQFGNPFFPHFQGLFPG